MAAMAVEAGFGVVAAANLRGSKECWQTDDVPVVRAALDRWRRDRAGSLPARTPLFVLGPSSGGFFATQAARHWRDVRAIAVQVSVPSMNDVRTPLPSGATVFPPLQARCT